MDYKEKLELQKLSCKVRMGIIEGTYSAKSGHPGGSLSMADMITYLYHKELRIDPKIQSGKIEIDLCCPKDIVHLLFIRF